MYFLPVVDLFYKKVYTIVRVEGKSNWSSKLL